MLRDKPYRERIKLVLALLAIWSLLPVFTKAGEATERKDFPEFSFDLPAEGWKEFPTPKSPGRTQWIFPRGLHSAEVLDIWPVKVPPALQTLSRQQHASKYFAAERQQPRKAQWEECQEKLLTIGGQSYPVMSHRILSDWGPDKVVFDGVLLLYFPPDFEKRQQFYALLWQDMHPSKVEGKGLEKFHAIVQSFRAKPLIEGKETPTDLPPKN